MDNTIHSDLIRGHINTIILKALYEGDRYGFDIIKEIEQKSSGQYILKQPTLYSCLKRLEVQGFIKSYWGSKSNGGRRKYYTLTDMGKDLFIKNQTEWEYSRTVIDKLISDKDFDLSSVSNALSDDEELTDDIEKEFNDNEQSAAEEPAQTPALEEQTISVPLSAAADENAGIINGERYEELSQQSPAQPSPQENQPQQLIRREYLDTTAIMNELFEQQMRNGESYTEKLKNEQYVPSEKIDSDNYFNNDYFNEAEAAEAVYNSSPSYDTDDILKNFEEVKPYYAPPVYIPQQEKPSAPVQPKPQETQQEERADKPSSTEFYSYNSAAPEIDEKTLVINREYKNILSQLRNKNVVDAKGQPTLQINRQSEFESQPAAPEIDEKPDYQSDESAELQLDENFDEDSAQEESESEQSAENEIAALSNNQLQTRNFKKLTSDVKDLGDGIKIRTHNSGAAKEYASTYYFYSNKLMLTHYLILFVMMLLEITVTFLAVKIGCPVEQKHGLLFYILAVVVSAAFPLAAFLMNLRAPEKRKRVSFNLRISLVFRFIVMIQALILIYAVNLMLGMRLTFDTAYLTTLLIPAIMSLNIPISSLIFQSLYKSGKYSVEG